MRKLILILLLISRCSLGQDDSLFLMLKDDSLKISGIDSLKPNSDSVKIFKLSVTSNLENAKVYSDTSLIGVTPLTGYDMKEGSYHIRIINPKSLQDWQNDNLSFDIYIDKDTLINADFKFFYFINTNPFDAKVYKNDTLLGDTPLRFFRDNEISGNLLLKKKNYKNYVFDLKNYNFETGANILLQPKGLETVNDIIYKDRSTQFKTKRSLLPILGTAFASIAGCVLAFNYKNTANDAYDRYLVTGNSAKLQESEDNDTYFLISVLLMEAAIGGLIYFLFFDK